MDNVSQNLIKNMNASVNVNTDGFSKPIEAILREKIKNRQQVIPPTAPTQAPTITIDGHVLPAEGLTLLMYVLASELSKNPEIKKILDQFEFKFNDVNGQPIYPIEQKKTKNVRSKK